MGLNLFKLEKLKIKAFEDDKRAKIFSQFEAMFNPTSFKRSYGIKWSSKQPLGSSGKPARFDCAEPSELDLRLLVDSTGVHEVGFYTFKRKSVKERVSEFMDVAFHYNGTIHEPNFLLVEWGDLSFPCRLKSVVVTYNTFDRDGVPLRAELAVQFISDDASKLLKPKENKTSPDLTHSRIVRKGDTLPLLTREIYGSSAHYLGVARFNSLDDFRDLPAGRKIHFPPLAALPAGA